MFKLADQPKAQTSKYLHTERDWEQLVHSPLTPRYYTSHFTHTDIISIRWCLPFCKEQQHGEVAHYRESRGAEGGGQEAVKRWGGGGEVRMQSLKISQTAPNTRLEPQRASIPSISAIFVACSIPSEVCLIS